ncbi:MAG: hypothetical protein NTX78_00390 [Rhodoluna sp.]|nr:hypothetical protein [Rhodoluna sp.]
MELRSERGTVTAELAISLPAVLLMLSFAIQALAVQVDRITLAATAGQLARAAARGEQIPDAKTEGNLICVEKAQTKFFTIKEKQCARRLGL